MGRSRFRVWAESSLKGMKMRIAYLPQKIGQDKVETDVNYIDIRPELVRPDGSWDISSQTVCTIEAKGRGSLSARFFVVVGIDYRGKPWASITSVKPNTQAPKTVFASWLDFAARAAKLIGGAK